MSEKVGRRIRFIYGAVTGCSCIWAGFCLIAGAVGIYRSGERPYTREAVATAFQGISVFVYIALALVVLGFLLSLFLPATSEKGQLPPGHMTLHRLHRKLDVSQSPSLAADIAALQRKRRLHQSITGALLGIGSVIFLIYACNGSNFHPQDINGSVAKAVILLLLCLSIPACYGIFAKYAVQRAEAEEIHLLLKYGVKRTDPLTAQKHDRALLAIRLVLLTVAVGITLYGLLCGGTLDVLTKAVNICTECIGLG